MDVQMPEMDGLEATRLLRARNNKTPIIAMTARAMTGNKKICREAGMNGYITKPFEEKHLARALAGACSMSAPTPR